MEEKFTYQSKPKGPPAFSGRSTAKMHRNLAQHQTQSKTRVGQKKQK